MEIFDLSTSTSPVDALYFGVIFSSPEPKAQVSFSDQNLLGTHGH